MSVTPNNIVAYGSVNMPEVDGVAVGGSVDFTKRVAFPDITPAGTVDVVSSLGLGYGDQQHQGDRPGPDRSDPDARSGDPYRHYASHWHADL